MLSFFNSLLSSCCDLFLDAWDKFANVLESISEPTDKKKRKKINAKQTKNKKTKKQKHLQPNAHTHPHYRTIIFTPFHKVKVYNRSDGLLSLTALTSKIKIDGVEHSCLGYSMTLPKNILIQRPDNTISDFKNRIASLRKDVWFDNYIEDKLLDENIDHTTLFSYDEWLRDIG